MRYISAMYSVPVYFMLYVSSVQHRLTDLTFCSPTFLIILLIMTVSVRVSLSSAL